MNVHAVGLVHAAAGEAVPPREDKVTAKVVVQLHGAGPDADQRRFVRVNEGGAEEGESTGSAAV